MWPWIQSAGWYRAMSRSRFEAKAGFKALPWNRGAMERGVAIPASARSRERAPDGVAEWQVMGDASRGRCDERCYARVLLVVCQISRQAASHFIFGSSEHPAMKRSIGAPSAVS